MKLLLTAILHFLSNPNEENNTNQSIRFKIKWLILLLILEIPIIYVLSIIQNIPVKIGLIDQGDHLVRKFILSHNLFTIIFSVVLIGPIIEEFIFRLPLRVKKVNFIPLILVVFLLMPASFIYRYKNGFSWWLIVPVLLTGFVSILVLYQKTYTKISKFLKAKYRYYFYFIAAVFALLHISNYRFSIYIALFAPLLILPQLASGLILGFLRVKSGFTWGYFFHAIHNAIFILPFYLIINQTSYKPASIIKKDGYSFVITEGNTSHYKNGGPILDNKSSTSKITPNEIVLHGSVKSIVARLTRTNAKNIKFERRLLEDKQISVYFKNDSAYQSAKTDSATFITLHNLLKKYKLNINRETRPTIVWDLSISDKNRIQPHISKTNKLNDNQRVRTFYGRADTIQPMNINSKFITRLIEINYNIYVSNLIDKDIVFSSIEIPNIKLSKLDKYLQDHYGLTLKKHWSKKVFLVIK